MPEYSDYVEETTTTTGTGPYALEGAIASNRDTFINGVGSSSIVYYRAEDDNNVEVGRGTVSSGSPPTLSRDEIMKSTNGGNKVSWGSGNKRVALVAPSELFQRQIPTVDTMQDLANLSNGEFSRIYLLGFSNTDDDGGGIFTWDPNRSKSDHDGGIVIDPDHSTTPGDSAWYSSQNTGNGAYVRVRPANLVKVDWYVSDPLDGDKTADAIQAAVDAMGRFMELRFGPRKYKTNRMINLPLGDSIVRGSSQQAVSILEPGSNFDHNTGDALFEIGGPQSADDDTYVVRDMFFNASTGSNGNDLSGLAVKAQFNAFIKNCELKGGSPENNDAAGLRIRKGFHTWVESCVIQNGFSYGILIDEHNLDLYINQCEFAELPAHIVSLGNIVEINIQNCYFGAVTRNNTHPASIQNALIDLTAGNITNCQVQDCTLDGGKDDEGDFGLRVNKAHLIFTGNYVTECQKFGIAVEGPRAAIISNNHFVQNGDAYQDLDPANGTQDPDTTPFNTDIFYFDVSNTPIIVAGNITFTTPLRPMAWMHGSATNRLAGGNATNESTVYGNLALGGAAWVQKVLVKDEEPMIHSTRRAASVLPQTFTIDPPSMSDGDTKGDTVTLYGVDVGDLVHIAPKDTDLEPGLMIYARVQSADTVKWIVTNASGANVDQPAIDVVISATKQIT